jgi:uncharacterized protein (TIGR04255 family)
MANVRHLNNAPIVEAAIAFDFVVAPGELSQLRDSFFRHIESEYPNQTPIQKAEITFTPGGSSGGTSDIVGFRCASPDGKNVCSISENTFFCSRLHPYQDWERLLSEFKRLWEIFASFGTVRVSKVAVRYINKIFIPEGQEIFDWIYTFPKLAPELPQTMFGVFVRLEIMIPKPPGKLIVTEAKLPPEKPEYVAIALDHDLQFPVVSQEIDVWAVLGEARELKNQYFFASVSEDLLKEYE